MTLQIDTLAYTNSLRTLPPEHKLLFGFCLLLLANLSHVPTQLLIALWLGVWLLVYAQIPLAVYWKLMVIPIGFWVASAPALMLNGIAVSEVTAVQADIWQGCSLGQVYFYLSWQGIGQAGTLLARAIAATSCLYFVMLTVPFVEILRLLRQCGCPLLLTDLLLLMYRFIFMLLRTADELWIAQQARSGYRTWWISMKSLGILVGQLLQRTLANYRQVSLSLASRGFTGEFRLWHSRRYTPSKRYSLEAVGGCASLMALELSRVVAIWGL